MIGCYNDRYTYNSKYHQSNYCDEGYDYATKECCNYGLIVFGWIMAALSILTLIILVIIYVKRRNRVNTKA
jgi:uncharacterized membrane protein